MLAEHGKIEKLPEIMSTHREHSGGIYNLSFRGGAFGVKALNMIRTLDKHYKHKYKKFFYPHARITSLTDMAFTYSRNNKRYMQSLYYAWKLLLLRSQDSKITLGNIKKLFHFLYVALLVKSSGQNQSK